MKKIGTPEHPAFTELGVPLPHYVDPGTIVYSEDSSVATGEVTFPSSDPTISGRGHANVAHFQLAVWNVAHGLKAKHRIDQRPVVTSYSGEAMHRTEPDKPYEIEVKVDTLTKMENGLYEGSITATLRDLSQKVHQTLHAEFKTRNASDTITS